MRYLVCLFLFITLTAATLSSCRRYNQDVIDDVYNSVITNDTGVESDSVTPYVTESGQYMNHENMQ